MGCLNDRGFDHQFANIHLSGPCNRSCYFCIGQHMMSVDALNTLDAWPLPGMAEFGEACRERGITEVNVTGTNTDPLLYRHTAALREYLTMAIPGLRLGLRTNGVLALARPEIMAQYDKGSLTVCSFDPETYRTMMGQGAPPDLGAILTAYPRLRERGWKLNVVLGPENVVGGDVFRTILRANALGIQRVNLREPYGQPHVGDPLAAAGYRPCRESSLGMPHYHMDGVEVWYWDVHYVEVVSVNLYANGYVSTDYSVTKGVDHGQGEVLDQSNFTHGRHRSQWQYERGSV